MKVCVHEGENQVFLDPVQDLHCNVHLLVVVLDPHDFFEVAIGRSWRKRHGCRHYRRSEVGRRPPQ